MTPIEQLKAEIDQLETQRDDAQNRAAAYVGSGEDAFTDPDVEAASNESERLGKLIEEKRKQLKKLGGDPLEGFVGATNADE
jgi:predicted ATPase